MLGRAVAVVDRRGRWPRLLLSLATWTDLGCRPASRAEPVFLDAVAVPPSAREDEGPSGPPPSIVSAHWAVSESPSLGGHDGLPIVFSSEVDAASLVPEAFAVFSGDGRRRTVESAVLSPANEDDENRTVLLIGAFGDAPELPLRPASEGEAAPPPRAGPVGPTDVFVVRPLFDERGRRLRGLSATVEPWETAGRPVWVELLQPLPGRCEGTAQVVRTYWLDDLRGVDSGDLDAVDVFLAGAPDPVHPVGWDDHDLDDESREDNVLDLCVARSEPVQRVRGPAALFEDAAGHPSAAFDLSLPPPDLGVPSGRDPTGR